MTHGGAHRRAIGTALVALGAMGAAGSAVASTSTATVDDAPVAEQVVALTNEDAPVGRDCPGASGLYWHFVVVPSNDRFEFVEITLATGAAVLTAGADDLIVNGSHADSVFVPVPDGAEPDDLDAAGSWARIRPAAPTARFVLSHVCIVVDESAFATTSVPGTSTTTTSTSTTTPTTTSTTIASTSTIAPGSTTSTVASGGATTSTSPPTSEEGTAEGGATVGEQTTPTTVVAAAGPTTTTASGAVTTVQNPVSTPLPATGSDLWRALLWLSIIATVAGTSLLALTRKPARRSAG